MKSTEKDTTIPAVTAPDPSMAQALAMIAEALKSIKTGDADAVDRLKTMETFLMEREAARPHENVFNPPMVSHYNPLGERDHPRPDLHCKMFWVGYELTKDQLTLAEIELLNRIQPGDYRVTKSDGKTIPFKVGQKVSDSGQIEHLTFHFPCKSSEDRQNHASMVSYLREALGETVDPGVLLAQIAQLKARALAGSVA